MHSHKLSIKIIKNKTIKRKGLSKYYASWLMEEKNKLLTKSSKMKV